MRRYVYLLVGCFALWSFLAFLGGFPKASAQDFSVDFSSSTGFGTGSDTFQINNISVTFRIHNPLTGETTLITNSYNVLWRWDQESIVLRPERAVDSDETCRDARLEVMVTNALTGEPIPGATVTVAGQSGITQEDGRVLLSDLPGDTVQVSVSAPGYVSQSSSITLSCDEQASIGISLLPENDEGIARGDIRIVLTWGENPRDLDSHLTGPIFGNPDERFHVYYAHKNNCNNSPCDPDIPAWLDVDDVTSYGPETITITKINDRFVPGRYRYSVHHFSGSSNIPQSQATVKIFIGDRLVRTYTPPAPAPGQEVGDDWVWTVCDIMIDESGNVSILDVNTYTGPTYSSDINSFNSIKTFMGVPVGPEDPELFRNLPAK